MRLTTEQRQVVNELIDEAHAASVTDSGQFPPAAVAAAFVRAVRDLEPYGVSWVAPYLDAMTVEGAKRECADWRRTHQLDARTKRGTDLTVPVYAGVRSRDTEGAVVYMQMPLIEMDLEALKAHHAKLARTRDTLSVEVRLMADLIELMEQDAALVTAGDALRRLGLAA